MANNKKNKKKKNNNNNNKSNKNKNNRKQSQKSRQNSKSSKESSISSFDSNLKEKSINKSKIDVFGDSDPRIHIKDETIDDSVKNGSKDETNTKQEICDNNIQLINLSPNSSSLKTPKGLTNLGNTCYLNSILQIISQTHILYEILNERSNSGFIWRVKGLRNVNERTFDHHFDEEIDVLLPNCLHLTNCLISFMREMNSNNNKTITPSPLLKAIRKDWSQFSDWTQQDSHELLRCLIDSVKCKEIFRQKKALLNELNTSSDESNIDDDTKTRIKSFSTYCYWTPIDMVFGGQLLSSVTCDECHYTNQMFEPIFDLSLPITQNKIIAPFIQNNTKVKEKKTTEDKCLLDEDSKGLTPKERKIKRQQKKAAKRVAKQERKISETRELMATNCDINDVKPSVDDNKDNNIEDNGEQSCAQKEDKVENDDNFDDWSLEPLLTDIKTVNTININNSYNEDNDTNNEDNDDAFGFSLLFESANNDCNNSNNFNDCNDCQNSEDIVLDYNLVKPDFVVEDECCSDESKAQTDSEFNFTELEMELMKLNISDKEKLSLIQIDSNSTHMKAIIEKTLEPISSNTNELLNFDLMKLLSNFTAIESLSGNNKYLCEICTKINNGVKTFTNASKKSLVAIPPPVLSLHLKRFEAEGYNRRVSLKKINSFISFPARFDFSPFVSKIYNLMTPLTGLKKSNAIIYSLYGVVVHSGTLKGGHYTAYVKCRPINSNVKKFTLLEPFLPKVENVLKMIENNFYSDYNINEDINYANGMNGGLSNGCINGSNDESVVEEDTNDSGKWYHISDSSVSSSSLSAVLRSQAYILFYERIV